MVMEDGSALLYEEYDIDHILSSFSELPLPPPPTSNSVSVTFDPVPEEDPIAASMTDLERLLMSDEEGNQPDAEGIDERFFDGLFAEELLAESDGSNEVKGDGDESLESNQEKERDSGDDSLESDQEKERDSGDDSIENNQGKERDCGDDPMAKKIRRQMRNRDSARSSRERKKQYIKELEMKSRFLESECKRLNYTLQCFMSENMALRHTLYSKEIAAGKDKKPHHAGVAMQESAVLFSESRQLGSLHWLVSIVWCLLLSLLGLHQPPPRTLTIPRRGPAPVPASAIAQKSPKGEIDLRFRSEELVFLRRRCKGLRFRMKPLYSDPYWFRGCLLGGCN